MWCRGARIVGIFSRLRRICPSQLSSAIKAQKNYDTDNQAVFVIKPSALNPAQSRPLLNPAYFVHASLDEHYSRAAAR